MSTAFLVHVSQIKRRATDRVRDCVRDNDFVIRTQIDAGRLRAVRSVR